MGQQWPDVSQIRRLRKASGLTQKQLSDLSGVQQSIISRIEEGQILDPSFSTVTKLFDSLQSHNCGKHQETIRAKDVMNRNMISISPHKTAKEAWQIMKENDFSQLPVIDEHGRIHGGITMQSLPDGAGVPDSNNPVRVCDIASDPFPIVGEETPVETLSALLRLHPAALVMGKGKVVGIVTKYDLVDALYSGKYPRLK